MFVFHALIEAVYENPCQDLVGDAKRKILWLSQHISLVDMADRYLIEFYGEYI
jgi:hypothetical protein